MFKKIDQNYLKGICLVAGTCIGAGMIGVPVKTSQVGLFGTIIAFIIVWGAMQSTALLFLEATLAFKNPANFISITGGVLGKYAKAIAWIICILFMYSVMAAYAAGGAGILQTFYPKLSPTIAAGLFILPFAIVVYSGNAWVSLCNRWLMAGVIVSFIGLCGAILYQGGNDLQPWSLLNNNNELSALWPALPLLALTFAYHEIIPPLAAYLDRKIKPLKAAIIIGTTIPLLVYIIWVIVILLLIPRRGAGGLIEMLITNKNPSSSLIEYLLKYDHSKVVYSIFSGFSFFALTCCLTGSSWALFDFFADGLKIAKNTHKGKLLLSFITFIPPIIYASCFPQGFLKALSLAGGFSAVIMIIYPVMIAWILRYKSDCIAEPSLIKPQSEIGYRAPFNKIVMVALSLFGLLVLILEIKNNL